ncbi:glutamate receptor 2.2-like [Impatiens glandulifera]|uniref:glutamate receptor 2.2-like n=1 Tax=Impatiens glandulifera TaxID=253017 RepID=UPI001FB0913A|nr:glutamate receptor 2.2-like [Impatiens glandulifera]
MMIGSGVEKSSSSICNDIVTLIILISTTFTMIMAQQNVSIGVVLDMDSGIAQMGFTCISMAISDFYASHPNYITRLTLHTRDSKNDTVAAAAAALDLLKNDEVAAIIGPITSMQAEFLINLGDKAKVPVITFTATSPTLTSLRSQYFIRAAMNDLSQVQAITAIIKAFGWRQVVPIYIDNNFGEGIIPHLVDALEKIDARVPYRSVIPPLATDDQIVVELYKLKTMQTRVFVLHMDPTLASRLFIKVKELGMMSEGYVWIMTNSVAAKLNSLDPLVINSMEGVLGVRPYFPMTNQLRNFTDHWRSKFKLDIFGLWAYDAVTALAMAVERVGVVNYDFVKANISVNSTDLEAFGVSQVGPWLLQALLHTEFIGLAGNFSITNGQLDPSAIEIVNVIGNGEKRIGFWTLRDGIVRELNAEKKETVPRDNLGSIIWPGDRVVAPKGWVIPTNGRKLRIGVPVKDGFSEFVQVVRDPESNVTTTKGYCIDVFDAVVAELPYAVPYEYIPFETPDGEMAGSYDELVYQVYIGKFDAVVGDTTIRANRSKYVDFTLPYTESGVSMIVPIKDNKGKNAWVFLKPLTWDLWLTSFCSFVFSGFVVWVLEHRINEDFRGPPSYQAGTILWFSFSTMVFAQKEKVVSNLARLVVIIWFFVVLILTQSYTASLTTMLTVQQLQPTINEVNELIKNGEYVGYQNRSFVIGLLKKMNIDESRIRSYESPEELDDLFKKGSKNGGIAAAFDEIPYSTLFLRKHCSKYTSVGPVYKSDGFGFVFPIDSPMVPDVSRVVLNVNEGDKMVEMEKKWFGADTRCPDSSTYMSSTSLGLNSFWGLFLIEIVASVLALVVYAAFFIYERRQHLSVEGSLWSKIMLLGRQFDKKDFSSHTFRKSEFRGRDSIHSIDNIRGPQIPLEGNYATETSYTVPNSTCPPTPSPTICSSNQTDREIFSFEGASSDQEYGNPNRQEAEKVDDSVVQLADLQMIRGTQNGHSVS